MPEDTTDLPNRGPIDTELLDRIAAHPTRSNQFDDIQTRPEHAPNAAVADYVLCYYPGGVTRVYLRIRWFETDDFSIHYSEQYRTDNRYKRRRDRHPNDRITREHLHPQVHRHQGKMRTILMTGGTYSQLWLPTLMTGSKPSGTSDEFRSQSG